MWELVPQGHLTPILRLDWCSGPKGLWSWGVSSPSVVLMTLKAPLGPFIRVMPPDVMLMAPKEGGGCRSHHLVLKMQKPRSPEGKWLL